MEIRCVSIIITLLTLPSPPPKDRILQGTLKWQRPTDFNWGIPQWTLLQDQSLWQFWLHTLWIRDWVSVCFWKAPNNLYSAQALHKQKQEVWIVKKRQKATRVPNKHHKHEGGLCHRSKLE